MDKINFLKEIDLKFKDKVKRSKILQNELNELFEDGEKITFQNLILFYDFELRKQDLKFPKIEKLLNESCFQVGRFLIGMKNLKNVDSVSLIFSFNDEQVKSSYVHVNEALPSLIVSMLNSISSHLAIFLLSDEIYKTAISCDDSNKKILARSEIQDYINSTIFKGEVVTTFQLARKLFGDCVEKALELSDCPTINELIELSKEEDFSNFLSK